MAKICNIYVNVFGKLRLKGKYIKMINT
jgi:hypothetical protein